MGEAGTKLWCLPGQTLLQSRQTRGNIPDDRWSLILFFPLINKLFLNLCNTYCLLFEDTVTCFCPHIERKWMLNCYEIIIRRWSYLTANLIFCSSLTGCSPTPSSSSPTVLCRWSSVLAGCWTETLPQHKRPKWETKTHSVSYKNSPTQKYAVFLNVQWDVRSGLRTDGPEPWCKCRVQREKSLPVCDPLSCQHGAAEHEHVHRWKGWNLWMTVSWVPLEIPSVTPDFCPPHLYPHYSSKTPHTW